MYSDLLVAFSESDGVVRADVWRREFPGGRQRRLHVSRFTLDLPPGERAPAALLAALRAALAARADYSVGGGA